MKKFIQLIRLQNIISLLIFQALMYYGVVVAILTKYGLSFSYISLEIILLFIASAFIAAAGYVVNDYFDTKIDTINKPDKVIIGKTLSRQQAAWIFQSLFGIGILAGIGCFCQRSQS